MFDSNCFQKWIAKKKSYVIYSTSRRKIKINTKWGTKQYRFQIDNKRTNLDNLKKKKELNVWEKKNYSKSI